MLSWERRYFWCFSAVSLGGFFCWCFSVLSLRFFMSSLCGLCFGDTECHGFLNVHLIRWGWGVSVLSKEVSHCVALNVFIGSTSRHSRFWMSVLSALSICECQRILIKYLPDDLKIIDSRDGSQYIHGIKIIGLILEILHSVGRLPRTFPMLYWVQV